MTAERIQQCPTRARHWFTYYGYVGSSAPVCRWCDCPNPKYDPRRDPYAEPETLVNP